VAQGRAGVTTTRPSRWTSCDCVATSMIAIAMRDDYREKVMYTVERTLYARRVMMISHHRSKLLSDRSWKDAAQELRSQYPGSCTLHASARERGSGWIGFQWWAYALVVDPSPCFLSAFERRKSVGRGIKL